MTLQQRIEELLVHWQATRGDRVTLDDFAALLDAHMQMTVYEWCTARARAGASIDEINAELQSTIVPQMNEWRAEELARLSAFVNDPTAPSHTVN
jgi:hypothetical protein